MSVSRFYTSVPCRLCHLPALSLAGLFPAGTVSLPGWCAVKCSGRTYIFFPVRDAPVWRQTGGAFIYWITET